MGINAPLGPHLDSNKCTPPLLEQAERKGDLRSMGDLEFYVANANARQSLMAPSEGFTPFEQLTGQLSRTVADMVVDSDMEAVPDAVNRSFMDTFRWVVKSTMEWAFHTSPS